MSLPIVKSALVFFSERAQGRPYNNCGPSAFSTCLRWAGYDIPAGFDDQIRVATGVPDYGPPTPAYPGGKPRGLSWSAIHNAILKLLPNAPIVFGSPLTVDQIWDKLPMAGKRNRFKSPVMVGFGNCSKLPMNLRRLVGRSYTGGHYVCLGSKTLTEDGEKAVLYLDPMGRPNNGYAGQTVLLSDFEAQMERVPGQPTLVRCAYVTGKNTAK